MEHASQIDLGGYSFDEFVSFLFDRTIPAEAEKADPWYWHVELKFDAEKICAYYVRLFQQPEFLLTRFTKPQLDEGFWAIQVPNLDCSAYRLILESNLPFPLREDCIRSMFDLFEQLFSKEPLDTSVQMWWDSLCYDWHCGIRRRERGGEDMELQDVFFQTLARILAIDSEVCQKAALHGLGHLHHPQTREAIDKFIAEHPSVTPEQREYALAAARFDVQ